MARWSWLWYSFRASLLRVLLRLEWFLGGFGGCGVYLVLGFITLVGGPLLTRRLLTLHPGFTFVDRPHFRSYPPSIHLRRSYRFYLLDRPAKQYFLHNHGLTGRRPHGWARLFHSFWLLFRSGLRRIMPFNVQALFHRWTCFSGFHLVLLWQASVWWPVFPFRRLFCGSFLTVFALLGSLPLIPLLTWLGPIKQVVLFFHSIPLSFFAF